jgi:heat shock protein HtpX
MHRLQTWTLLTGLVGLFVVVGTSLFGWAGALVVLAVAWAVNQLGVDRARDLILRWHRARPLRPGEAPDLQRLVADLSRRAGIAPPALALYPSPLPNAFALGARRRPDVIALSHGLLSVLSPRQVRGVVAHEIAHLSHRDSALSLTAGLLVQVTGALSQSFALLLLLGLLLGVVAPLSSLWPALLVVLLAPTVATLLQAALMRTRERLADAEAARLTGDPRALATALVRLQEATERMGGWLRRFRFLYTTETEGAAAWLRTHPPTHERVRDLLALESQNRGNWARVA